MSTREADSLLSEFKNVIKEITVEVAKQSVVQDLKRSEEVMRYSSTALGPVANSLQVSAKKLEEVLQSHTTELQKQINQRFANLESSVMARLQQIEEKNDKDAKELKANFQKDAAFLKNRVQELFDDHMKMSKDFFEKILTVADEERAKAKNVREWMFALLGIQIAVIIVVPVFWHYLLK